MNHIHGGVRAIIIRILAASVIGAAAITATNYCRRKRKSVEDHQSLQCKLAENYVKKPKEFEVKMLDYFAEEPEVEVLYVKLMEQFERCIHSYFAFHWNQAPNMISQGDKGLEGGKGVLDVGGGDESDETCLRRGKVYGRDGAGGPQPAEPRAVAYRRGSFWADAAANAVVVEADAFKETDVIFRALSSRGHHHDMLPKSELVHQSSIEAASSLLVTALNEGRDLIMDGTLSWDPFVKQTINMARNVHKHRYRKGVGYKVDEDDTINEKYWEQINEDNDHQTHRKPYRIELVGVVCDAYLAVVRGISARLYCTNALRGPPKLIGWKDGDNKLLIDPDDIQWLSNVSKLNPEANCVYELYEQDHSPVVMPGSVWKDVFCPLKDHLSNWSSNHIFKESKNNNCDTSTIYADLETEAAPAGVPKKRTFKKFSFRGVDLDSLLDMSTDELVKLFPARARRRFQRGLKRKPMALIKKLRKAKREAPPGEKPEPVRTHLRNMIIVPEMIGSIIGVYNGKTFNQVEIKPEMISHYLAEFSISYKPVKHGRPGIGATHSSRFIPLK
ncbi:40S ribosomal protein S15 [Hibiscus syriacus]|uniref:40S ribosomal protein S15 n=1 Tax=Hibiscus syriacus TaxID=106335 RepID=A0A6A3CWE3_HIBSY|nr:40S ribosomal protein S15 [Hibiscus syriacus]